MPIISVIVTVYNETINEINKCINSILKQTYTNFECIIVDDNPNNITIKHELINLDKKSNKIKIIFHKKNLGLIKSENDGIKHAHGKIIARVDADDISKRNRLFAQLKFMERNNLDLACSNCSLMNDNNHIFLHHYFSNISQCNQNKIKHIMSYCNVANGPTFLFKKDIVTKIGFYRVPLIDDYEFATRALIYGYRIGYQSKDLIIKTRRSNSITNSNVLKQFSKVLALSKFIRKTHFKKTIPMIKLEEASNKVTDYDSKKFKKFIQLLKMCKRNKSIIDLFKAFIIFISNKIILKRVLWNELIGKRQNNLIK